MKPKKIIVLFLAAALLLPLAACGKPSEPAPDTQTPVTGGAPTDSQGMPETEPPSEMDSEMARRASVKDSLPDNDYDGSLFRISVREDFKYEVAADDMTGESLNDALYERNQRIEGRFGVEILAVTSGTGEQEQIDFIRNSVMAQDDAFDLAGTMVFVTGSLVTSGYYMNWLNLKYNDFSRPWWIHGVNDNFRVEDAIYTVVGDMCLSTLLFTYGLFYNMTRGEDLGLNESLFETVLNGEWTYDRFFNIVKDVYVDDGDGARTENDFYGFVGENATNLDIWPFAFDIPIIRKDDSGEPALVYYSEKAVSAVEKITQLYWDTTGSYVPAGNYELPVLMFRDGHALFTTTWFSQAFGNYRDMADDYIILPYPKWDESQEKYMTGAMDNYTVLGVPITVSDSDMASIIAEALNVESYRTMFPTYYEEALQFKLARDPLSIEMLNLIMDGRSFDFSTLFHKQIPRITILFRNVINQRDADFVSYYASCEGQAENQLDEILTAYFNNAKGN